MIYRLAFLIISLMIIQGCNVSEDVKFSSGVQYLGDNEKIISGLENLNIDYKNIQLSIDLDDTNKKLILIEPHHIKDISKEDVRIALKKGFYIFFINMVDNKELQEKYFNFPSFEMTKDNKAWAEQLYLKNGELSSMVISTKGNIEENVSTWLSALDEHKVESR